MYHIHKIHPYLMSVYLNSIVALTSLKMGTTDHNLTKPVKQSQLVILYECCTNKARNGPDLGLKHTKVNTTTIGAFLKVCALSSLIMDIVTETKCGQHSIHGCQFYTDCALSIRDLWIFSVTLS